MELRDYQRSILDQLTSSATNDIVQLDTGAGKTPIEAALAQWAPHCLLVAHRNVLIRQISEKLAAFGLEHDTISTEHTRRRCIAAHRMHGRSYIVRGHPARRVASMQSIVAAVKRRRLDIDTSLPWLIVVDEAHHVVPDNMWGSLRELFPNARIVGFTATPARMDGESLHVAKGGMFDRLVQAPELGDDSIRALIDRGYLSQFRAYAAVTSYRVTDNMTPDEREEYYNQIADTIRLGGCVPDDKRRVFSTTRNGLDWASGVLELVGDPVEEYRRLANGTRAILMAPAIKNAEQFAKDFRAAGIPAACINSTQSPTEIAYLLDAFASGHVRVLTNVDMVGEGFDLPACETLIIATRTASFPRYRQWCGRVLRPAQGKERATIIDLTGMIAVHGMPDEPVKWDLLNPPVGPKTRRHVPCDDCGVFFDFKLEACPECGAENRWLERGSFSPGSFMFDIRLIDQDYRGLVLRERERRRREMLEDELAIPLHGFFSGSDIVSRSLEQIAQWFPRALQEAGIPVREINEFLHSPQARDSRFYLRNFTRADVGAPPTNAVKAFKQWLKSR